MREPCRLCQVEQEPQRLFGDAVLRIIEVDAGGFGLHPLATLRVVGEQLAQVPVADHAMMGFKRLPGGMCVIVIYASYRPPEGAGALRSMIAINWPAAMAGARFAVNVRSCSHCQTAGLSIASVHCQRQLPSAASGCADIGNTERRVTGWLLPAS
jgi:hypothetical protein